MRCFELKEGEVVSGLKVQRYGGAFDIEPCVHITSSGEFYFSLDESLVTVTKKVPQVLGVRLYKAEMTADMLAVERVQDRAALVRIEAAAGEGGSVMLTSCAFQEFLRGRTVEKAYMQFPSIGVSPLGEVSESPPWRVGADKIELAVVMQAKSSFRIQRTGRLQGEGRETFVRWDGRRLTAVTPGRRKETPRRSEATV